MANTDKPNVEFHDPAKRPSLDDQGSGPAERAVLGTMGMGGVTRLAIAIVVFIAVCGTAFYLVNG
ncbi:hypothetical protein NIM87_09400 [Devosia sp. XJ19-1]|uniref:Uncharacterized protein n=1 Tax=Devosia ureilytica TaxID=2952754 RepID=A0A9Q4FSW9_9HYPH|nr:hypothetical protein [Devosia ureilytica]MCP8883712.1 hypothetical protein [Devosia ureilytica]MCP8887320.1 hypothetical protein [Devosia ureilytica]